MFELLEDYKNNIIEEIEDNIKVSSIGQILQINEDNTFKVRIIEKVKYKNKIKDFLEITCNQLHNTNGLNIKYNINDFVLILYTDINYKKWLKEKPAIFINNKDDSLEIRHTENNGIIIGKIDNNFLIDKNGFTVNDSILAIDNETKKIIIQNIEKSIVDILKTSIVNEVKNLIDSIKTTLSGATIIDPQSGSPIPLTFDPSGLDSIKSNLSQTDIDIDNLFIKK